jgi:hypothetical protein
MLSMNKVEGIGEQAVSDPNFVQLTVSAKPQ